MRILHITDSHGTVKAPESRTDLYYLTFLRKFAEITYLIKLYNIDMIIHTGDLFHSSRVSNKFMGQLAEIIKSYNIPMYVVPGNHDIDGYNLNTIDQTSLGLLSKTGVLSLLTRDNPLSIQVEDNANKFTLAISGQEYYAEIDKGNPNDYLMQQTLADINILAVHSYIADTIQHPDITCTYPSDIVTDADVILTGHYHNSFESYQNGVSIYNPGSMMRVDMSNYNYSHMPQYGLLDINTDEQGDLSYDYNFHQFRVAQPGVAVFDYAVAGVIRKQQVTLENFKENIAKTMNNVNVNSNSSPLQTALQISKDYVKIENINQEKEKRINEIITNTYNSVSNTIANDDVINTKGYIPLTKPIKLKSILIENFQGHENTYIELDENLNMFIGESMSGKTSILRLIGWVVNNSPLGTDFIQTGKDFVKGVLTYDNGTVIERYRTRKDTGYYKVTAYNDITKQIETNEYKGFTNNIPVEVLNAHQMPKISITKNIETHLNIMTQLEKPFLITESTNEKAAAIGRITGTNIIDAAIKENHTAITVEKRVYKHNLEESNKIKEQLESIPYDKLVKLQKYYKNINKDILAIQDKVKNIKTLQEDYVKSTNLINHYKNTIRDKNIIISNSSLINSVSDKIDRINTLITLRDSFNETNNNIDKIIQTKERMNIILQTQEYVKNAEQYLNNLVAAANVKNHVENRRSNIQNLQVSVNQLQSMASNKNKVEKINNNILSLVEYIKLYEKSNKSVLLINENKAKIDSANEFIKIKQEDVKNTTILMNKEILQSGVCPCCNQVITEDNVEHIANSFLKD